MKYKIIFLLLFLFSCTTQTSTSKRSASFTAKGFAYILPNNLSPKSLDKETYFISHNKFKIGTKIRIINPDNKKFLELIVKKRIKYDDFYKILISESIMQELNLDQDFPFIEVNEIRMNKSFIAEKAVTEKEERLIPNKAPIEKINIDNISIKEQGSKKSKKTKTYSILVADFYSQESAELLRDRLAEVLAASNYQMININKKNDKSFELLMGPYNTINKLKNDYNLLTQSKFEDLDIKIND